MVGLNIKNERIHELVRELARLTGESQVAAVDAAVRERLERIRREQDVESRVQRLLAIARDCTAHMSEPLRSSDINEMLYDDSGLPR